MLANVNTPLSFFETSGNWYLVVATSHIPTPPPALQCIGVQD